jgi:hypothetical protein
MRLILIDNNSGYVFGDTAVFLAGSPEWRDDVSAADYEIEPLALLAARLLDESAGRPGRAYPFVDCDPIDTSTGYHVYRADAEGHEAVPLVYDGQNQAVIDAVAADCRYVGFVRCEAGQ